MAVTGHTQAQAHSIARTGNSADVADAHLVMCGTLYTGTMYIYVLLTFITVTQYSEKTKNFTLQNSEETGLKGLVPVCRL